MPRHPPGSSSPSLQPDGFTQQRVYLKLSSPFPPGQRPGPALLLPHLGAGSLPSPHPISAFQIPCQKSPCPGGPPRAARGAPEVLLGGAPEEALLAVADPNCPDSSPLPRGKGTRSLSQSPGDRLFKPHSGRREGTPPPVAPPSSCHHSPALQGLTFEFVICFGLLVKLLPYFEIRHDPRLRLHVSSCPSLHYSEVRAEPGGGGEVAGLGPASVRPAQCLAQPAAPAAAPAPGVHTRPGREGQPPA